MNHRKFVSEQVQAQELLDAHNNGLSFNQLIKKSTPLVVIRLSLIALCAWVYFSGSEHSTFAVLAGGVLLGALAQDFGWFARTSAAWPLTEKVTDWEKVEAIAQNQSEQ